jgi:aspartyl-tRNA(Asn)/glutamyl-tRNA(Gln) amidotransferase subunit A
MDISRRALIAGAGACAAAVALRGEPLEWTLVQAASAIARRTVSSEELTKACLERIEKLNGRLNAFISVDAEGALQQARECDRWRTGGRLHGVPIALKDNIDTAGVKTTAAAAVFRDRIPSEDAEVTRRLKAAGAVFLGKLNLDEMAFAGTGTTGCFGPARNPWNTERITGGSSAGSAAAVAAGMCFGSVGSDDGGSVRIPGAHCGVVGFKTSYGRVSTRGVVPSAYSMDTIGPIARTVEDTAALLQVIAGYDPLDAITRDEPVPDYSAALRVGISNLRVGVPREYFFEQLHPDVAAAMEEAIRSLHSRVREIRDVTLPRLRTASGRRIPLPISRLLSVCANAGATSAASSSRSTSSCCPPCVSLPHRWRKRSRRPTGGLQAIPRRSTISARPPSRYRAASRRRGCRLGCRL